MLTTRPRTRRETNMTMFQLIVLCCALVCSTRRTSVRADKEFSNPRWDGNVAYFAVPRDKVASKLAELQSTDNSDCGADKLTLPNRQVLPGVLQPDQHVVAVSFGELEVTSHNTELPEHGPLSMVTNTVQFFIPFLTAEDPDAIPVYKLALTSFVAAANFANPNPCIPTESVDYIGISATGVSVWSAGNSTDMFSLSMPSSKDCVTLDAALKEEFESYNTEYTLSFGQENPCACQYWAHDSLEECHVRPIHVDTITERVEEMSLLTKGQSPAILSVANKGTFHVRIKNPCFNW